MAIIETSADGLILGEISAVQGAMRRNARWASSASALSAYGSSPNPNGDTALSASYGLRNASQLRRATDEDGMIEANAGISLSSFAALRAVLRDADGAFELSVCHRVKLKLGTDLENIDALVLLNPFLNIIRSGDTSGPITALALTSVDKFISYGLVQVSSPNAAAAMAAVSAAGTHCKFEASDSTSDEVVLLKILDVLKNALTSPLGDVLTDEAVCEMMETGLSMCCQMRLSEMLRRSAERTMQTLVASVFRKLQTIPDAAEGDTLPAPDSRASPAIGAEDSGLRVAKPDPKSADIPAASSTVDSLTLVPGTATPVLAQPNGTATPAESDLRPYGLPSIRELLRVLISLLNPHDQQHTDSMRLMALNILNIALEIGGRSIGRFPSLRVMVADDLCKYLFQLVRSDNTPIFTATLRVITTVFDTLRMHLKLQQELFSSFVMERLTPSATLPTTEPWDAAPAPTSIVSNLEPPLARSIDRAASPRPPSRAAGPPPLLPETRELMLDHLAQLASRSPDFMIGLWTNYDCSIECEDVFERMVKFMCRGVYPQHHSGQYRPEPTQLMCLDVVLAFVNHVSARLEDQHPYFEKPSRDELQESKARKRLLLAGAARFNEKPKDGIKMFEQYGLFESEPPEERPTNLARFLATCPRLNKQLLGDYLSRPENLDILKAFMLTFDFSKKIISDAMRELLESFRLPGESQQIARITETFAEVYIASKPVEVKSQDAAYVLAYSVIMLNTDLHNPQNRKRMTIDDYRRNLRGVNDGSDFAPTYLQRIYDSIWRREIIMPEEHHDQLGFEYAWRELLRRSHTAGLWSSTTSSEFDRDMFTVVWKPVLSAIAYAFTHFGDDHILQRAIGGFRQCAELASRFEMPEVFDYIIFSLATITGLAPTPTAVDSAAFPVAKVENAREIVVSPLSIRFGTNQKAQLAAVVLFSIAISNGAAIRSGWVQIFELYQTLFVYSLLPASLLNMEDFLAGTSMIPMRPKPQAPVRDERRNDGGLLSTLSSYLLAPYSGPGSEGIGRDVSADDIENTLSTVDCIASCRVEDLHAQMSSLPPDTISALLQALVTLAERLTINRLRPTRKSLADSTSSKAGDGSPPPSPASMRERERSKAQLAYDPSSVFLLELMVSIGSRATHCLPAVWPIVFDFLSKLLAAAPSYSSLLTERAVVGLLRLAEVVAGDDDLHDQLFVALGVLRGLPPAILSSVAEQLAAGLLRVVSQRASVIRSTEQWDIVFDLVASTAPRDEAARLSFDLLTQLSKGDLGVTLNAVNFSGFIRALDAFVAAAGTRDIKVLDGRVPDDPLVQRAIAALELVRGAHTAAALLTERSPLPIAQAWERHWMPVLSLYARQSVNGCREVRQASLASLQRTLVAHEVLSNAEVDLVLVFEQLIFPTLDELLKPQVFRRDPEGMGETRLQASALVSRIFLHYLTSFERRGGKGDMTELWLKILGSLDRMMHSGRRDQMYEAVPEQIKNLLLVMSAQSVLVPPGPDQTAEQAKFWDATWTRIETYLPSLKTELFPPAEPEPEPAAAPTSAAESNGA